MTSQLSAWISEVSGEDWVWHAKYLSANDTYAKRNVHQGGPHVSKALLATAFPILSDRARSERNPDTPLFAVIDSHAASADLRLVWYNSKRLTGQRNGRDEARLTRWGGSANPIVAPDATGSLVIFAFRCTGGQDATELRVWRCRDQQEEDSALDIVAGVEPGEGRIFTFGGRPAPPEQRRPCGLSDEEIPAPWRSVFPAAQDLVDWSVQARPERGKSPDVRLMSRRDCELALFQSVERSHVLPRIVSGFTTVDEFVAFANAVVNRRRSRSGRSLELHVRRLLDEEGISYSPNPYTEDKSSPDFVFPSIEAYHSSTFPASNLRMLAAKTTCKERWRQVLRESKKIESKHLLTLQEGVSIDQHREMASSGIVLVVPRRLVSAYPEPIQSSLMSLDEFFRMVRSLQPRN